MGFGPLDVTVVVASQNRRAELLRSLSRHEAPVILIDNGSSDGTVAAVRAAHPQVTVVALTENRGAPARNIGVVNSDTELVAFADDDSWWAPGALERAAEIFAAHPRLAVLAGRILVGPEQRLDGMSRVMATAPFGTSPDLPGPNVTGFVACGAIVRRAAFASVGGFDPVVFFPGEEERVTLDLLAEGWGLAYVDEVVAHHHPSRVRSSPGARVRLITRNAILTAVMRRSWMEVGRRVFTALTGDDDTRAGLAAVLPRLPAALRRRRRVPQDVEDYVSGRGKGDPGVRPTVGDLASPLV